MSRILHIVPQLPYFDDGTVVGGHGRSVWTLARAQSARGDKVQVLTYSMGHHGKVPTGSEVDLISVFSRARPGTLMFAMRFLWSCVRWIGRNRGRFDVLHFHSGFSQYFIVSRLLRAAARLPTVHTLYCPIKPKKSRSGGHQFLRFAKSLDARVGISENVSNSLSAQGLDPVWKVFPAVDTEAFAPEQDSGYQGDLLPGNAGPQILFVGNATRQKNLSAVLSALHALRRDYPDLRLVVTIELARSSSDESMTELREQVLDLDLQDCVAWKGIVDDMPQLMRASDVLVAPFLDTFGPSDFPIAALEAMSCGTPTVVAKTGAMPEIMTVDVGRVIDPLDASSLIRGLDEVLNREKRTTKGSLIRELIVKRFGPDVIAEQYESIYAHAIDGRFSA